MTPCYQFFAIKILCNDVSSINCTSINFLNSAFPYSYVTQIKQQWSNMAHWDTMPQPFGDVLYAFHSLDFDRCRFCARSLEAPLRSVLGAARNLVSGRKAGRCASKEVLYLCLLQGKGKIWIGGGECSAVTQPVVLLVKTPACSFSSLLAKKMGHGIKGALLVESKHKPVNCLIFVE